VALPARHAHRSEQGSSPPIQNVDHPAQRSGIEIAINANAATMPKLDEDRYTFLGLASFPTRFQSPDKLVAGRVIYAFSRFRNQYFSHLKALRAQIDMRRVDGWQTRFFGKVRWDM
jgi:hypothetical protein